jgi:hypothetical protein
MPDPSGVIIIPYLNPEEKCLLCGDETCSSHIEIIGGRRIK